MHIFDYFWGGGTNITNSWRMWRSFHHNILHLDFRLGNMICTKPNNTVQSVYKLPAVCTLLYSWSIPWTSLAWVEFRWLLKWFTNPSLTSQPVWPSYGGGLHHLKNKGHRHGKSGDLGDPGSWKTLQIAEDFANKFCRKALKQQSNLLTRK